jgi:hypothetical protein
MERRLFAVFGRWLFDVITGILSGVFLSERHRSLHTPAVQPGRLEEANRSDNGTVRDFTFANSHFK